MTKRIEFREVRERAHGAWGDILTALAPSLQDAVERAPRHVSCPVHGGKDGFRLYKDFGDTGGGICNTCGGYADGFALLAWVKGYTVRDAFHDVAQWLGIDGSTASDWRPAPKLPAPRAAPAPDPLKREKLRQTWAAAYPASHPAAEPLRLYLTKRGLDLDEVPAVLRLHPGLPYFVEEKKKTRCIGRPPALIALVHDANGVPVTLHRTYLDMKGNKSPVPEVKKLMPAYIDGGLCGGAIRLYEPGPVLGVAEGIETALAVHCATGMPVWACVTATLLQQVAIPECVEQVIVWADLDRVNPATGLCAGSAAAEKLVTSLREKSRNVEIVLPPGPIPEGVKKIDWLDVYNTQGKEGFPAAWRTTPPGTGARSACG